MPIYTIKLINRREVARATIVCEFEKPDGFKFVPGQYGGFTHINPSATDAKGNTRRFSILSTPDDENIAIVTRIQSSAFKNVLNQLGIGSEIKLAGPSGNFVLPEDTKIPVVLIAGGIGIAPFYSMIRYACTHQPDRTITLFYGNLTPATAAFHYELLALAEENKHFHYIPVMSESSDWQGEQGYVTHTIIKKYVADIMTPHFYVCGAPVMVSALQETLLEMGIPENHIMVEDFPGY